MKGELRPRDWKVAITLDKPWRLAMAEVVGLEASSMMVALGGHILSTHLLC